MTKCLTCEKNTDNGIFCDECRSQYFICVECNKAYQLEHAYKSIYTIIHGSGYVCKQCYDKTEEVNNYES